MKEIHKPALTANMAMVTDAKGNPIASDKITTTELNMLNNIRTNVQTQLDAKIETSSIKKAQNGYVKFSNGVIIQWGLTSGDIGSAKTVTLPVAFSSTNYSVITTTNSTGGEYYANGVSSKTTTSFKIQAAGGASTAPSFWIAIGY